MSVSCQKFSVSINSEAFLPIKFSLYNARLISVYNLKIIKLKFKLNAKSNQDEYFNPNITIHTK